MLGIFGLVGLGAKGGVFGVGLTVYFFGVGGLVLALVGCRLV